ncbi:MAG: MarR family transcriptional regulator [Firmicutes bacterium]|nr:MarR family transcriptional regulator [Bacillota bacterium]
MDHHDDRAALALMQLQDTLAGHYAGLSRHKMRLMVKLEHGPLSVSELAERLHISSPAVSQMIDKLATEGYVRRDSLGDDLRMVGVSLTDSGRLALAAALDAFRQRVNAILSPLDVEEKRTFVELITKISEATNHE